MWFRTVPINRYTVNLIRGDLKGIGVWLRQRERVDLRATTPDKTMGVMS